MNRRGREGRGLTSNHPHRPTHTYRRDTAEPAALLSLIGGAEKKNLQRTTSQQKQKSKSKSKTSTTSRPQTKPTSKHTYIRIQGRNARVTGDLEPQAAATTATTTNATTAAARCSRLRESSRGSSRVCRRDSGGRSGRLELRVLRRCCPA